MLRRWVAIAVLFVLAPLLTLASDGTVRHILVIAGLRDGLTESAIRAVRQIKFIPATIDGRPVSMFIQLEYNFNLF